MKRQTIRFCWLGLLTVVGLIVSLSALALAGSDQPNPVTTWAAKGSKVGGSAPKSIDRDELVAIARSIRGLHPMEASSTTTVSRNSHLGSLLQSRLLSVSYPDSTFSDTRDWNIRRNGRNATPIFVSNLGVGRQKTGLSTATTDEDLAMSFVQRYKSLFRLDNPAVELQPVSTNTDRLGKIHVRLQQMYEGIPVWGKQMILHVDPVDGIYAVTARYSPTPRSVDLVSCRISVNEASSIATSDLSGTTPVRILDSVFARILNYHGPETQLCIWIDDSTQTPHLTWFVEIRPNVVDDWYYFIDAHSGAVLHKYNNTNYDGPATATALDLNGVSQTINTYSVGSLYYLIDASRPIWQPVQPDILNDPLGALVTLSLNYTDYGSVSHVTSSDNSWSDPVAVSAHYNVAQTFDYYYSTFGREAIDDSGTTIVSVIHKTEDGMGWDNACWNTAYMLYGDGRVQFKPLAGALDVAAHEMTHGVVQHTVNLVYEYQSGALNESFADVLGCMVDRDDWLMGEDIVLAPYYPSGAMRDLSDPHNGGTNLDDYWQPAHMSEYRTDTSDHGGVHTNSGIPNHAAYLIATGIGKDKLEQIYYRILDARYLPTQAQFVDMRLAAIQSATDLYGASSAEVATVEAAFDAVGILDGSGTTQPPDTPPREGDQWIALVNGEETDNSLYKASPDSPTAIVQLTNTQVFTSTSRPITVTSDGDYILFVDTSNFIRAIGTDGMQEEVISASGDWRSIALSPDNRKLAATSKYEDSSIYIFDLLYPDSTKTIRLYCPTTDQAAPSYITRYADALDWNLTGEYLLYDALSSVPQSGGGSLDTWSVFLLDVASGTIYSLFPPLPPGLQMGNPAFANTNDIYVVCDLIDLVTPVDYIYSVNLFSGVDGLIENNGESIGYPDYSTDDTRMVFQRVDGGQVTLRQISLDVNRIDPAAPSSPWLLDAARPAWYVVPTPLDVDDSDNGQAIPGSFALRQNYPNPFNPTTTIEYSVPRQCNVTVDIFNLLGQRVCSLVHENRAAGTYRIEWNGRNDTGKPVATGVYFYRVQAGKEMQSRKMLLLK